MAELVIPRAIVNAMLEHAARELPLECCGILGGAEAGVRSIFPLTNIERSPTRYLADSRELVRAVRSLRDRGEEIVAIYHSHPSSPPFPSRTDLAENHYGDLPRIIISFWEAAPRIEAWTLLEHSYEPSPWRVLE